MVAGEYRIPYTRKQMGTASPAEEACSVVGEVMDVES